MRDVDPLGSEAWELGPGAGPVSVGLKGRGPLTWQAVFARLCDRDEALTDYPDARRLIDGPFHVDLQLTISWAGRFRARWCQYIECSAQGFSSRALRGERHMLSRPESTIT
jgi:hypothetical protein